MHWHALAQTQAVDKVEGRGLYLHGITPLYLDVEDANHLYPVSPIAIGLGGWTYTQEVRRW